MSKGAAAFTLDPTVLSDRSGLGLRPAPSTHQNLYLMLTAITQKRDLVAGQDLSVQRHLPDAPIDVSNIER
jgi:hypothetical protein